MKKTSLLKVVQKYLEGLLKKTPQTNLRFKFQQWLNYNYGTWFCESKSETILRDYLKKKYSNYVICQQYRTGNYRIDFYIPSKKVAIEVDGFHHGQDKYKERDKAKDQYLKENGIKVIRINASDLWKKGFEVSI